MKKTLQKIIGAGLITLGASGAIGGFYMLFPQKYSSPEFVQAFRLREEIYARVNEVGNPENSDNVKRSYEEYEGFVRDNNLAEVINEYDSDKKGSLPKQFGGAILSIFSFLTLFTGFGALGEVYSKK